MTHHYRTRPDLCPGMGHPGVTYNTALNRTWCLCGAVQYDGETPEASQHLACCGGPLTSPLGQCNTCTAVEGERHRATCPEYVPDDALTLFGRVS